LARRRHPSDRLFKELVFGILKHHTDQRANLLSKLFFSRVETIHQNRAGRWQQQPVEMLNKRALAGAGVPDDTEKFAVLNG
jgi:hypothetical protein